MSVPLRRNIGLYETLAGLPEGLTGEILDGQTRPTGRHAHAESVLGMRLGPPYRFGEGGPGGWWILIEPEVHFVRDAKVGRATDSSSAHSPSSSLFPSPSYSPCRVVPRLAVRTQSEPPPGWALR